MRRELTIFPEISVRARLLAGWDSKSLSFIPFKYVLGVKLRS